MTEPKSTSTLALEPQSLHPLDALSGLPPTMRRVQFSSVPSKESLIPETEDEELARFPIAKPESRTSSTVSSKSTRPMSASSSRTTSSGRTSNPTRPMSAAFSKASKSRRTSARSELPIDGGVNAQSDSKGEGHSEITKMISPKFLSDHESPSKEPNANDNIHLEILVDTPIEVKGTKPQTPNDIPAVSSSFFEQAKRFSADVKRRQNQQLLNDSFQNGAVGIGAARLANKGPIVEMSGIESIDSSLGRNLTHNKMAQGIDSMSLMVVRNDTDREKKTCKKWINFLLYD